MRTRRLISGRFLTLMVMTALVGGFVLGYITAFLMWWNR